MRNILQTHDLQYRSCVWRMLCILNTCVIRLLSRFPYMYKKILKYASIAFCADCSNSSKPTHYDHKQEPIASGFGLRPMLNPVNTWLIEVICCHHEFFFSLQRTKNVLAPFLDAFCILISIWKISFRFKNATNELGSLSLSAVPGPTVREAAYNLTTRTESAFGKKSLKWCLNVLCTWV